MKTKIKILAIVLSLVSIVAILQIAGSKEEAEEAGIPSPMIPGVSYVYTTKYICGPDATNNGRVVDGVYLTAVNVHNPQSTTVTLKKKVVQALSEDITPLPPSAKLTYSIRPDYAFEIDCKDIKMIGNITIPFSKGFVVIESPMQLDVVGVYTSMAPTGGSNTLDIETIKPKIIVPAVSTRAVEIGGVE